MSSPTGGQIYENYLLSLYGMGKKRETPLLQLLAPAPAQTSDAETTAAQQLPAAPKVKSKAPKAPSKRLKAAQAKIKKLESKASFFHGAFFWWSVITVLIFMIAFPIVAAQCQFRELQSAREEITAFEIKTAQMAEELDLAQARIKDFEVLMAQMEALTQVLESAQERVDFLEAKAESEVEAKLAAQLLAPPTLAEQLRSDYLKLDDAEYFVGHHLVKFSGKHLRIEKSGLKSEHIVQFLDDWLTGFNTVTETIIVRKGEFDDKAIFARFPFKAWDLNKNNEYHYVLNGENRKMICPEARTVIRSFDGAMASVAFYKNNEEFWFTVWKNN